MTNTIDARRALEVYSYLDNPEVLLQIPQPHRMRLSKLMHGQAGDRQAPPVSTHSLLDRHRQAMAELLELMRRLRAENGSHDHVSACLTVFYALAFVVEDFAGQQALAAEFHEFERSSNHGS